MNVQSKNVERPPNLNTAATLMIVNGCLHILGSLLFVLLFFLLVVVTLGIGLIFLPCVIFPLAYLFWGIFEIVTASRILKGSGLKGSPFWVGIVDIVIGAMAITTIHGIIILILGIINTILLNDEKVKDYFRRQH